MVPQSIESGDVYQGNGRGRDFGSALRVNTYAVLRSTLLSLRFCTYNVGNVVPTVPIAYGTYTCMSTYVILYVYGSNDSNSVRTSYHLELST